MNLHERILPFLVATAQSAGIGKVVSRRRFIPTDADIERELGADDASGGRRAIRCCFVTRTSDAAGETKSEPSGHEYAITRAPEYEFEIWYGYDDSAATPSETEVDAAYEALVAKFDEQTVRSAMYDGYRAVITAPLAMTERSTSIVAQQVMVSRIVAVMKIEGEAQ